MTEYTGTLTTEYSRKNLLDRIFEKSAQSKKEEAVSADTQTYQNQVEEAHNELELQLGTTKYRRAVYYI